MDSRYSDTYASGGYLQKMRVDLKPQQWNVAWAVVDLGTEEQFFFLLMCLSQLYHEEEQGGN